MPKRPGKHSLSVYIDQEQLEDVKKLADARRRSVNSLIVVMLEDEIKAAKKRGEI